MKKFNLKKWIKNQKSIEKSSKKLIKEQEDSRNNDFLSVRNLNPEDELDTPQAKIINPGSEQPIIGKDPLEAGSVVASRWLEQGFSENSIGLWGLGELYYCNGSTVTTIYMGQDVNCAFGPQYGTIGDGCSDATGAALQNALAGGTLTVYRSLSSLSEYVTPADVVHYCEENPTQTIAGISCQLHNDQPCGALFTNSTLTTPGTTDQGSAFRTAASIGLTGAQDSCLGNGGACYSNFYNFGCTDDEILATNITAHNFNITLNDTTASPFPQGLTQNNGTYTAEYSAPYSGMAGIIATTTETVWDTLVEEPNVEGCMGTSGKPISSVTNCCLYEGCNDNTNTTVLNYGIVDNNGSIVSTLPTGILNTQIGCDAGNNTVTNALDTTHPSPFTNALHQSCCDYPDFGCPETIAFNYDATYNAGCPASNSSLSWENSTTPTNGVSCCTFVGCPDDSTGAIAPLNYGIFNGSTYVQGDYTTYDVATGYEGSVIAAMTNPYSYGCIPSTTTTTIPGNTPLGPNNLAEQVQAVDTAIQTSPDTPVITPPVTQTQTSGTPDPNDTSCCKYFGCAEEINGTYLATVDQANGPRTGAVIINSPHPGIAAGALVGCEDNNGEPDPANLDCCQMPGFGCKDDGQQTLSPTPGYQAANYDSAGTTLGCEDPNNPGAPITDPNNTDFYYCCQYVGCADDGSNSAAIGYGIYLDPADPLTTTAFPNTISNVSSQIGCEINGTFTLADTSCCSYPDFGCADTIADQGVDFYSSGSPIFIMTPLPGLDYEGCPNAVGNDFVDPLNPLDSTNCCAYEGCANQLATNYGLSDGTGLFTAGNDNSSVATTTDATTGIITITNGGTFGCINPITGLIDSGNDSCCEFPNWGCEDSNASNGWDPIQLQSINLALGVGNYDGCQSTTSPNNPSSILEECCAYEGCPDYQANNAGVFNALVSDSIDATNTYGFGANTIIAEDGGRVGCLGGGTFGLLQSGLVDTTLTGCCEYWGCIDPSASDYGDHIYNGQVTGNQLTLGTGTVTIVGTANLEAPKTPLTLGTGNVTVSADANVEASGNNLIIRSGSVTITGTASIEAPATAMTLGTGEVGIITWNEIIPGATMVWTPIKPY